MAGECRKLELLVAALLMSRDDLAVKVLGMGQPFDELILVCEKAHPEALILFSNYSHNHDLAGRLNRLALTLDCRCFLPVRLRILPRTTWPARPLAALAMKAA